MHARTLSNGSERCNERLNGFRKTFLLHSKVYITCGGDQETLLNRQLQRMLSSIGKVLCGDEKLFGFTTRCGIVRKVPKKPARMGIRLTKLLFPSQLKIRSLLTLECTTRQETLARAPKLLKL